jgi:hypothetical protein
LIEVSRKEEIEGVEVVPPVMRITFPSRGGMSLSGLKETADRLSIPYSILGVNEPGYSISELLMTKRKRVESARGQWPL